MASYTLFIALELVEWDLLNIWCQHWHSLIGTIIKLIWCHFIKIEMNPISNRACYNVCGTMLTSCSSTLIHLQELMTGGSEYFRLKSTLKFWRHDILTRKIFCLSNLKGAQSSFPVAQCLGFLVRQAVFKKQKLP